MRSSKSRSRSKSNRPRPMGNIVNRVFDSSGPEGKVRGTPQQIIEKYLFLARDAQLSNDRVSAENFLQHAEHYTRMLGEANRELAAEQEARQAQQPGTGPNGNGQGRPYGDRRDDRDGRRDDDRAEGGRGDQPRADGPRRDDRNDGPRRDDRGRDDRGREERGREERGDAPRRDRRDDPRSAPRPAEDRPDLPPFISDPRFGAAEDDAGLVDTPEEGEFVAEGGID